LFRLGINSEKLNRQTCDRTPCVGGCVRIQGYNLHAEINPVPVASKLRNSRILNQAVNATARNKHISSSERSYVPLTASHDLVSCDSLLFRSDMLRWPESMKNVLNENVLEVRRWEDRSRRVSELLALNKERSTA
jgi:hypothetical protein